MEKLFEVFDIVKSRSSNIFLIVMAMIFFYILWKPEEALLIQAKVFGLFPKISKGIMKKKISAEIRGTVIKTSKSLLKHQKNILPNDLKIHWSEKDSRKDFFDDGKVIIYVEKSDNPNENYVNIIFRFVDAGLFNGCQRHVDDAVLIGTKLLLTEKMLGTSRKEALDYFHDVYIKEHLINDDMHENYELLRAIDESGMFIAIYLNEVQKNMYALSSRPTEEALVSETREFLRFLQRIAIKISEDPKDLNFNSNYFKVSLVYFGVNRLSLDISDSFPMSETNIYKHVIKALFRHDRDSVYIMCAGRQIALCKKMIEELERDNVDFFVINSTNYKQELYNTSGSNRIVKSLCVELVRS